MSQSYCVVKTIEKGSTLIMACPKVWVKGNILLCPSKGKIAEARRKISIPKSNWKNFYIEEIMHDDIGKY